MSASIEISNKKEIINKETEKTIIDIILETFFKFLKFYSIKVIYIIFINKNLLFSSKFHEIFKKAIDYSNISSSIIYSMISLIYKALIKLSQVSQISNGKNILYIKILSACLSIFVNSKINNEDSFRFYILMVFIRLLTDKISSFFKKNSYFQENTFLNRYLLYFISVLIWSYGYFLNPGYKYIPKTMNNIASYDENEKKEFFDLNELMKVV